MSLLRSIFASSYGGATSVRSGSYSEALDLFLDQMKSSEQGVVDWIGSAGSTTIPFFGENPLPAASGGLFVNDAAAYFEWPDIGEGVSGGGLLVGQSLIEPPCNIPLPEIDSPIIETSLPVPDTQLLEPACSMPAPIDPLGLQDLVGIHPLASEGGGLDLRLDIPGDGVMATPLGWQLSDYWESSGSGFVSQQYPLISAAIV